MRGVGRIYPVAVIDDALQACRQVNYAALSHTLLLALSQYGLPQALLTDHDAT
jgi:hypothetical protein